MVAARPQISIFSHFPPIFKFKVNSKLTLTLSLSLSLSPSLSFSLSLSLALALARVTIIEGTTLNTVEATTVHADDDAMNIVENAPIPALGQVACLPTMRRESARLKARRQPRH